MSGLEFLAHLLIGWIIADFLSGLLHWLEDRVLWRSIPLIGPYVVEPNRLHHEDPLAFTKASFISRNSTTWVAVTIVALLWLWLLGPSWILAAAFVGGMASNEVHARAHLQSDPNGLWAVFQEIGIVQSRAHHWGHHKPPMDRRYCVLTDWLNPLLDWIGLWAGIEHFLTIIGLEPNRGTK